MNYLIRLPIEPYTFEYCIGYDPGTVNAGLAVMYPETMTANVYEITMQRDDNPIRRVKDLHIVLSDLGLVLTAPMRVCIEGAAYGATHRQVELSENRIAALFWFERYGAKIKLVPPLTIRKGVFGNGKISAHEVWEGLPKDALAALSCAYYAANCWEKQNE